MQRGKRQLTAFGLLLLVALPLFLSVGIFFKQKILQLQRRQRFNTEVLETITVAAEKIYWVKPEKEILVNGNLFDVKSYIKKGAEIILTGFYDDEEDKLAEHAVDLIHKNDDPDRTINQVTIKFLFYPDCKECTDFSIQNNWRLIDRQFPVYKEAIASLAYPAPTPPPRHA